MTSFAGLETFYYAYKNQIKKDTDAIVVFVHWYLVKHGFVIVDEGKKTEILPQNWNTADEHMFLLNYTNDSKGFELKVLTIEEDSLIVSLMKKATERTGNVNFSVKNHVTSHKNDYNSLFVNINDLFDQIHKEFEPLYKPTESKETKSGKDESKRYQDPYSNDPLRVKKPASDIQIPSPTSIGRSDLDPFGRFDPHSGGMIFNPFERVDRRTIPTNLPRGAVPPGARFDPFGPPDPDDLIPGSSTRVGPNPNNFKPPGFDDMFM